MSWRMPIIYGGEHLDNSENKKAASRKAHVTPCHSHFIIAVDLAACFLNCEFRSALRLLHQIILVLWVYAGGKRRRMSLCSSLFFSPAPTRGVLLNIKISFLCILVVLWRHNRYFVSFSSFCSGSETPLPPNHKQAFFLPPPVTHPYCLHFHFLFFSFFPQETVGFRPWEILRSS